MDNFKNEDNIFHYRQESDAVRGKKHIVSIIIEILLSPKFQQLSENEKLAYSLYRQGYDFDYIAKELNISKKTCYDMKYKAEKKIIKLSKQIKENIGGESGVII